ncbi:hypothetical protein D1007_39605 [Hordeum vulgare]|uniref:Predicted protein n=1 Tax=Hordeum vulgare subsp. vulgare TaxID=112509 RepID=F2DV21_HORVV|nr:hypothetical protein D1007_39605 [Hordeum vulgare]BAJ98942.1 predicted protein [Hordeum vulgare subsp. vulgare]
MFGEDRGWSYTSAACFVCLSTFSRNRESSYTLDRTIFVRLLGEPRKVEDCCNDGLALTPLFPMSLACRSQKVSSLPRDWEDRLPFLSPLARFSLLVCFFLSVPFFSLLFIQI